MTRIYPGNLVEVRVEERYYYALILSSTRLFGANWVYAFHTTTKSGIASADEVLGINKPGFHAFVDFIWAKQEARIVRVAKDINIELYNSVQYLKNTHDFVGKAPLWFITDMNFQVVKQVSELSEEEKHYPFPIRIDDTTMAERINRQWKPDVDPRI